MLAGRKATSRKRQMKALATQKEMKLRITVITIAVAAELAKMVATEILIKERLATLALQARETIMVRATLAKMAKMETILRLSHRQKSQTRIMETTLSPTGPLFS